MIPSDAKINFQKVITYEMSEMDQSLLSSFSAIIAMAASHGAISSGRTLLQMETAAVNSLKARGQFILGQLLRCITAYHVPLTTETVAEADVLLRETILLQIQTVQLQLFSHSVFKDPRIERAKQEIQTRYLQEGPKLIDRLSTELSITAAASISQNSTVQQGQTFNINAPVGLIQTGNESRAIVHQHIDMGVKSEIVSALQNLLVQIERPENDSIGNRAELKELVVETKAEAEKKDSNFLKLGSSLRTIAETIKFIGSLGPAYTVIKPLLSYFGIQLP